MYYWTAIVVATFPAFVLFSRAAFRDLDSFVEGLVLCFTPVSVAALNGEAGDAATAKVKFFAIFAAWAAVIAGIHATAGDAIRNFLP